MYRVKIERIVVGCHFLRASHMEKNLLEILACPICKGELVFDKTNQELICRFDHLAFPLVDDIPVMLESRARRMEKDEG